MLCKEHWRDEFTYDCDFCYYRDDKKKQVMLTGLKPFGRAEVGRFRNYMRSLGFRNFKIHAQNIHHDGWFNVYVNFK
jgi:hypothetical protein